MRGELWIPGRGMELHDEYPVPEPAAMRELWLGYVGSGQIIDAPAVDGAVRVPEESPVAYASIDLCEVLRETFRFMRQLEEPSRSWRSFAKTNHYTDEDPFVDDTKDTTSIVQVMMAAGFMQPSDGIEEMADIMRDWRRRGIYTFANTSTLPGCETGTVNSFFMPYLPGCFDGLLLPRNHEGLSPMTKGIAARNLIEAKHSPVVMAKLSRYILTTPYTTIVHLELKFLKGFKIARRSQS